MNSKVSNRTAVVLLVVVLIMVRGFGLVFLSQTFLTYLFSALLFFWTIKYRQEPNGYSKWLFLYVVSVLGSCVYSDVCNDQNFFKVVMNTYPYWGILITFFVLHLKPTIKELHDVILALCVLFCFSYILQYIVYPFPIFAGALDKFSIHDGEFRMRMPCSICSYCLFFYGVNLFLESKKLVSLAYVAVGMFPILVMGFRSLTVLSLLCTLVMIVSVKREFIFDSRNIGKVILMAVGGVVFLISLSNVPLVRTKIDEMMERQLGNQTFTNEDYIRYVEYDYYTTTVFKKPASRIFGGGVPVFDNQSKYSKDMLEAERLYYFWMDLGLVGLSFIIGVPAVLLLVWMVIKCIYNCKAMELQFVRYTLLTILLGSLLTTMELYRAGNLIMIGLFLCLEYTFNKNLKKTT